MINIWKLVIVTRVTQLLEKYGSFVRRIVFGSQQHTFLEKMKLLQILNLDAKTERMLSPDILQTVLSKTEFSPSVDLFASRLYMQ